MPEIFWSPYENKTYTLTKKSATYKEIITFIRKNSVPLVGQRTKKNDFKYTERPMIVAYYDVNYAHDFVSETQFIRNKILEVRVYFHNNLRFTFQPIRNRAPIFKCFILRTICHMNSTEVLHFTYNCFIF